MGKSALSGVAELVAVITLVFAIGGCGTRLAEAVHRLPVGPAPDHVITLRIAKSDRQGDVTFQEGSGYAGWWHCKGDWAVKWNVAPKSSGQYQVLVRVSCPDRKQVDQIKVDIGDQQLVAAVPQMDAPSQWKDIDLGVVSLEAKPYSLTTQPAASNMSASLNVKLVILRPVSLARPAS